MPGTAQHIVGNHHLLGDLLCFTALVFEKCFSVYKALLCSEYVVIFSKTMKQMVLYPEILSREETDLPNVTEPVNGRDKP